jgi:Flp pilus assembly protein TadG
MSRIRSRPLRGSAIVENALVLLVLLTLILGMLDLARGFVALQTLSHATGEGARWASVRGSTSASPATSTSVANYVKGLSETLDKTKLTITTTWTPNNQPGGIVQVQAQYNFTPATPFIPSGVIAMTRSSRLEISR